MKTTTRFRAFSSTADALSLLNTSVEKWIQDNEAEGYTVEHKTVHVERRGDNANVHPIVVVTVWMHARQPSRPTSQQKTGSVDIY